MTPSAWGPWLWPWASSPACSSRGERLGIQPAHATPGYVSRLFDDRRVHQIDLQVEDWAAFVEHAPEEEYIPCTVVIDGEEFRQVGLRAKGNNSLPSQRSTA